MQRCAFLSSIADVEKSQVRQRSILALYTLSFRSRRPRCLSKPVGEKPPQMDTRWLTLHLEHE